MSKKKSPNGHPPHPPEMKAVHVSTETLTDVEYEVCTLIQKFGLHDVLHALGRTFANVAQESHKQQDQDVFTGHLYLLAHFLTIPLKYLRVYPFSLQVIALRKESKDAPRPKKGGEHANP